jgi:dolichyl-phosphate beta-glucosyltransferase
MSRIHLAVPCFNEARRIDVRYWELLIEHAPNLHLTFVDDGSSDSTGAVLQQVSRNLPRTAVLQLPRNVGKANAVRLGMSSIGDSDEAPELTGYLDCDGAYPPDVVVKVLAHAVGLGNSSTGVHAVFPQRSLRDGSQGMSRQRAGAAVRRYLSAGTQWPRDFDWQAGFKLYSVGEPLMAALQRPFMTRWFPDVEIICRVGGLARLEQPRVAGVLHVGGSTVSLRSLGGVMRDLVLVKALQLRSRPVR